MLKNVASLYHQAGWYKDTTSYHSTSLQEESHPVVVLKVAATLNKQLTDFINVNTLAPMKDPILVNWYTAKKTRTETDELYFFSIFEKLNSNLYYKWKNLKDNHEKNYEELSYLHRSHEEDMATLCKTNDCINHQMLDNLKELESYSQSLDLLKHLEFAQLSDSSTSSMDYQKVSQSNSKKPSK